MINMAGVLEEAGTVFPSRAPGFPVGVLVGSMLLIFLLFCVRFFALFFFVLCLVCQLLPMYLNCSFLIAPSVFSNVYVQIEFTSRKCNIWLDYANTQRY